MILKKSAGTTSDTSRIRSILAAFALLIALVALPLTACSSDEPEDEVPQVDVSSWTTLGDGVSAATDTLNFGYDDNYFVCVFYVNDSVVRVVAKMEPGIQEQLYDLDHTDKNYDSKLAKIIGGLSIVSAEDISATKYSQDDLTALIGQDGDDLADDGFEFVAYTWYGGEQTAATFANGCFEYGITFDVTVTEDQVEDGGKALEDAKIVSVDEFINISDAALDPAKVE